MPNSIHVVSYSEIQTFRQCPHRHDLAYRRRWTGGSSPALDKGKLWHAVMEAHYKLIMAAQREGREITAEEIFKAIAPMLWTSSGEPKGEIEDLIAWMYQGYVEKYGIDQPAWKILAVEHEAEVWLPTDRGTRSNFKLKIKIDLITEDRMGRRWLWDHKSGQNLPTDKELAINDQFGLYTWALRKLRKKVFGAIHNAARTQRNKDPKTQTLDNRMSRTLMYRTDRELDTIAIEAWRTMSRAYAIPAGKAERAPNEDTCRWRCGFTEPCLAGRKGVDEEQFLRDLGFVVDKTRH